MAFRATPGRTPPGPGPRSGIPSASFPSPQPPMAGPGGIEEEDEEEPAEFWMKSTPSLLSQVPNRMRL
uniref:MutS homolog 5 n=1 Tax=Mus musculus TaxID=10090 RepID=G3UWT5_MOUSE